MTTCDDPVSDIQATAARYGLFSGTAGLAMRIGALLRGYIERRRRRLGTSQLTALDERTLKDIGLTSAEVDRLAGLPLEMGRPAASRGRSRCDPVHDLMIRR